MHDHVVIIGYGHQGPGRSVRTSSTGTEPDGIAVIDIDEHAVQQAADDGALAICGDAAADCPTACGSGGGRARLVAIEGRIGGQQYTADDDRRQAQQVGHNGQR